MAAVEASLQRHHGCVVTPGEVEGLHGTMNGGTTILVIEDDSDARVTLCEILTDEGYECVEASDGRDAMQKLVGMGRRPSVILLDLMMPGMNGWQFREWQRQSPDFATIPVVVLSAATDAAHEARRLEAADFIAKPIHLDRLLDTVRRYCPAA
ncbi:MAG: response regulator [Planctomycetota bacterium]